MSIVSESQLEKYLMNSYRQADEFDKGYLSRDQYRHLLSKVYVEDQANKIDSIKQENFSSLIEKHIQLLPEDSKIFFNQFEQFVTKNLDFQNQNLKEIKEYYEKNVTESLEFIKQEL